MPIHAAVITAKLATLYEVKYLYYYEDILDLYELLLVNNYNEYKYNKLEQMKAESKAN